MSLHDDFPHSAGTLLALRSLHLLCTPWSICPFLISTSSDFSTDCFKPSIFLTAALSHASSACSAHSHCKVPFKRAVILLTFSQSCLSSYFTLWKYCHCIHFISTMLSGRIRGQIDNFFKFRFCERLLHLLHCSPYERFTLFLQCDFLAKPIHAWNIFLCVIHPIKPQHHSCTVNHTLTAPRDVISEKQFDCMESRDSRQATLLSATAA